jgi:hypothetical protein
MVPCIDNQIPVYIRNIFNRAFPGSVIQGQWEGWAVSGVTIGTGVW